MQSSTATLKPMMSKHAHRNDLALKFLASIAAPESKVITTNSFSQKHFLQTP